MNALVSVRARWEVKPPTVVEFPLPTLEDILALETLIQTLPQPEFPVREFRIGDLYAREMMIRKGLVLTGAVHKTRHLVTISQGDMTIWSDGKKQRLKAPCTFESEPGVKRVGFAHEDTVFTTYHVTQETDHDRLIEELCTSTRDELMGGSRNKQMLNQLALKGEKSCHLE